MAGSIFFNVSADAARPRVLLYLVVTLAPFLVMAPLVGPIVDRVRGGLATTMIASFVARAVLALLLAENLRTLLLFPLAFGVLVVAKTYTVSRNALLPALVDDRQDLVSANARLSRSATIAGGVAAAAAVSLFAATSGVWTLRVGAAVYVIGAFAAYRVRAVAKPIEPIEPDALLELVRPDVSSAVWDMMALRAAIGFAIFQFGFSLRSDGEPAWVFGLVILANGIGGFTGTVISAYLRRHITERSMFTAALVGAAGVTALCGLAFSRVTLIITMYVLGLAASVGRRALDATIQTHAPHARRAQVYAGLETRLELAWVAAAVLAVAIRIASWIGVLALGWFLGVAAIIHLRRRSGLDILRPVAAIPLPERLLLRAETLADHGFHDEAIVVARAAVECDQASRSTVEPGRAEAAASIEQARRRIGPQPDPT
jgi:MFS family permease